MCKIVILLKEDRGSWGLIPGFLDRVKNFCSKYDTDTDGIGLCRLLEAHFIADDPKFIMLAAVKNGEMVGHALASVEYYYGRKFLNIIHLELDEAVNRDDLNRGFEAMLSWGMLQGAEEVRISTSTRPKAKMLKRFYGFKPHRMVMVRPMVKGV